MNFKPKKQVKINRYVTTNITCLCGNDLNVGYEEEGKLVDRTWCVDCNRYYERRKDHYIITGYRCFECQTQHKELYTGFDNYGHKTRICKDCLEKQLKSKTNRLEELKKETTILNKREKYQVT